MKPVFYLIFCFIYLQLQAQHPYYYTLNDENGLPSNEVYQVIQDDFGFIWIGCDAGLFRYDGFNFHAYTNSKQNSKSISNLKTDSKGNIWCQNFTGQIFKVTEDSLKIMYDAGLESKQFPAYLIDKNDKIWIANDGAVLVLDDKGKQLFKLKKEVMDVNSFYYFDLEEIKDDIVCVPPFGKTLHINKYNYTFKESQNHFKEEARSSLIKLDNKFYFLREILPNRNYLLHETDENGSLVNTFELPNSPGGFHYHLTKADNTFYLCGSDGIYILDENFKKKENTPNYFPGQKISYLYKDREGNLWATSLQDGIFIIPSTEIIVWNKTNSLISDNNISYIQSLENKIILGTYTGVLFTIDIQSKISEAFLKKPDTDTRAIRAIQKDGNKIYAAQGPFRIYDGDKKETIQLLNNSRDFSIRNDTIFYITTTRIGFYDIHKKQNTILLEKGGRKVCALKNSSSVYYATDNGFLEWKNGTLTEIKFKNKPVFTADLTIRHSEICVATQNSEILLLKNNSFRKLVIPELNNNTQIKSIYANDSLLIFAGSKGLTIYHFDSHISQTINFFDGLAFKEINKIILAENQIYLATLKGVVSFPIDYNSKNEIKPGIKITSVLNEHFVFDQFENIEAAYGDINLKINFISTSFRSRGSFHYEYRIKNFSDRWIKVNSSSPQVLIPFLPAGEFIFEVVAVNEDGVRSDKPAQISITVHAPYWQKWWFYGLLFLLVVFVLSFIFLLRIRYLHQKSESKNRVILSQLTALKAQMNPHFMYNTLNSIQDLILQNDIKSTNYYLSKFSTLMRMILKASQNNKISIDEEIEILEMYLSLEKLRFGEEFTYLVKAEFKNKMQAEIPSMILQPYVENAVKHGLLHKKGGKHLDIIFTEEENYFSVSISDNGIGRNKSAEIKERQTGKHASFATQALEKRIELLSEYDRKNYKVEITDLYHDNGNAAGTKVIVKIPF
jgi:two-component sensor histidine kinase